MKNVLLYIMAMVCPIFINGQNIIEKYYSDYVQMDNITEVYMTGKLFDMASIVIDESAEDEELGNLKDFVGSIEAFHLIAVPDLDNAESLYNDGRNKISRSYDLLMEYKDDGNKFSVLVKEAGGVVEELVGIGTEDKNQFIVFTLNGQIDLDQVGALLSKIKAGQEDTGAVLDSRKIQIDEMKIYPNPVGADATLHIEIPDELVGGKSRIYDMSGTLVQTMEITGPSQRWQTTDLSAGYYLVELQKGGLTMKKKFLVTR